MSSRKNKIESSQNRSMDHRPGPSEEATRDLGGFRGTGLGTDGLSNSSRFSQNESKPRESSQRGAPSRRLNINKGTNQLGQGSTSPKNPCVDDLTTSLSNIVRLTKPGENSKEKGRAVGQKGMKAPRVHLRKSKEVHLGGGRAYKTMTPASFVGASYQTKVTMALLQEIGREKYDSPLIGIEVKAAMSMDDIVLQYTVNERKVCLFLQIKHIRVSGKISFQDLISESSQYGAFYLKKYFDSYLKIMKGPLLKSLNSQEKQLVIFTSGRFDQDLESSFEPFIDKDSILNSIAKEGSGLFKFKKGDFDRKKVLISQLNPSYDIQEVTDFFDCLVFAVGNHHDGEELDEHIKERLGESFNLGNANIIFASLFYGAMSWAQKRKKYFLNKQDVKRLFERVERELDVLVAIGPTQLAFGKVKGLGLVYDQEATKDLRNFLNNRTQKVLNLVTEEIILGAGKIVQILDDCSYSREDSYILTNLEDLLALERLVSAFELEVTRCLLVVMCKPVEDDVQKLFLRLRTLVQTCDNKKVILITEQGENDSLHQKILNTFSSGSNGPSGNHYKEIRDKKSGFKNLDSKSQGNLQKSEISFQGKTMSLGQITTPEFLKEFICGKELLSLQDKKFKIGGEIPVVQYASIDRTFISRFIIKESALTDQDSSDIFTIIKAKSKTFSKLIPKNNVIELDEANPENHFKQVCELKKEHNIHYLSIEKGLKGKLILAHQKSRGSLCNLRQYINLNTGKDEDKEEFIERRLAILAGEPGTGKSSIMDQLCRLIKDKFPLLWIIKINLIECRSKLLKMDFNNNSLDQVVDFLSISRQVDNSRLLSKELLKYYLQQRDKVALLFDGFNEVGSVNEEKVLRLLKILRDLPGPCKLYVSVRSYIKDRLEDSLGIFSCELNPLQPKVQKSFLQYLLKKEISKSSNVDEKRISTFVGKLLKFCSETTNEAFGLDNPLCLKMLASFFAEEFQKFYNSENECDIRFDNFNFLNLYEYHLAHKICIHIDKNITIFSIEFAKLLNKNDLLHGKNLCKEKRYALETLSKYKNEFAAIFLEILFGEEKYSNQLKLGQEHKDDLHNIGTLHQCLYEYHVAKFFVDECLEDLNNRDLRIFELLKKYYFHPDGEGMRHFFDLIVSRDCSLHVDVINGDFDKVKILIRSKNKDEETKLLKLDPQDRSILHLVREGDYKKVADVVKEEAKSAKKGFTEGILCELIERKDKVFGYTSFEYAVRSGSWKIVEKFLELKGWFKKTGYVASVERNMRLPTTSLDILQADSLIKSDLTLHKAIKIGYFYFALWMISMLELNNKLKAELEKEDSDGRKPLYYIMCENKAPHSPFHMLELISNRVDLNKPDRFGQTAAHFLVLMMDKVKKDEDIFLKDYSMSLVLDILGIMKRNKVNMDVRDKSGNAPIHLVSDRLDIIKYLAEENLGVNLNLPRKDGKTLVHLAVIRGDCQMIKYLAYRGASLNERDSDGNTPLHFTAMLSIQAPEGHNQSVALEIAKFLVGSNVDFNVANKEGKVPAEVAAGDVREYLRNLPTHEELLRNRVLRNVRHLQDLVVYKEEELDKVLLQLRRGVEVLLKLIDQQIGCVRNLRMLAITLFYELRETDLPLPLVVEVVDSINDTLIKKLREQQLQELDNKVKELLLQDEQFVQLFGQSLMNQANILEIGSKISQLSWLLELMGKQYLKPQKWSPPTPVDFVRCSLRLIRCGIGEIQNYQIKFLDIVVRGKAVWPDYDGKKERAHCKEQLEVLSLMDNPRVFVLDRIDSLRYLNRKEVRETKLLLVRDVQKELEGIYDSLSDSISVY